MRAVATWTCGLALLLPTVALAQQADASKDLDARYKQALALDKQKKHADALKLLEPILQQLTRSPELKSPPREEVLYRIAIQFHQLGQYPKAEQYYLESLELYEAKQGHDSLDVAGVLWYLGRVYGFMGKWDQASSRYQRAAAIRAAKLGPDHERTFQVLADLASAHEWLKE